MDVFRPNDTFLWSCQHSPSQDISWLRVLIVAGGGSFICVMSLITNLMIIFVFQTSLRLRRQNYANPVILAIFDMLVPACFLLIVTVPLISYYFNWIWGIWLWIGYVKYTYLLRHFCESMCNFLLLMASIERLLGYNPEGNQRKALVFFVRYRRLIFFVLVVLSVFLKGTLLLETDTIILPRCLRAIDRYVPIQVNSTYLDKFSHIRFWSRKTMSVIFPFVGLVYCNYQIIQKYVSKRKRNAEQSIRTRNFDVKSVSEETYLRLCQDRKGVKAATLTLIMVVACYILTNTLSLAVSVLEQLDIDIIQRNYFAFSIITDFSWLLTILGCAFRIFIYIFSDQKMKKALARAIFRFRVRALPSKELEQHQLDKLSMQGVSNSLRSNLTNANMDAPPRKMMKKRKVKDELGSMVHLRGNFVVNVTMRLGSLVSQPDRDPDTHEDWLTDIQEEDSHFSRRGSRYRSICADTHLLSTEELDENAEIVDV